MTSTSTSNNETKTLTSHYGDLSLANAIANVIPVISEENFDSVMQNQIKELFFETIDGFKRLIALRATVRHYSNYNFPFLDNFFASSLNLWSIVELSYNEPMTLGKYIATTHMYDKDILIYLKSKGWLKDNDKIFLYYVLSESGYHQNDVEKVYDVLFSTLTPNTIATFVNTVTGENVLHYVLNMCKRPYHLNEIHLCRLIDLLKLQEFDFSAKTYRFREYHNESSPLDICLNFNTYTFILTKLYECGSRFTYTSCYLPYFRDKSTEIGSKYSTHRISCLVEQVMLSFRADLINSENALREKLDAEEYKSESGMTKDEYIDYEVKRMIEKDFSHCSFDRTEDEMEFRNLCETVLESVRCGYDVTYTDELGYMLRDHLVMWSKYVKAQWPRLYEKFISDFDTLVSEMYSVSGTV